MKEQEAKLRSKYPGMKPGAGGSSLLQKRLSKGVTAVIAFVMRFCRKSSKFNTLYQHIRAGIDVDYI